MVSPNFLANRQQCINVNGHKSPWKSPKSGIPQRTVLGPVLFLVFINDLPSVLKSFCSIFADDTTAYTIGKDVVSTCSNLSKDLDVASGWARTWGMLFNPEKSKHLAILKSNRQYGKHGRHLSSQNNYSKTCLKRPPHGARESGRYRHVDLVQAVTSCGGSLANLRCGGCFKRKCGVKATIFLAFGRLRQGTSGRIGAKNLGRWSRYAGGICTGRFEWQTLRA